jgi:hypothetical protein
VIRRALPLLLLLIAAPSSAQNAWEGRVRLSFSAGAQVETARLAESIVLTHYVEDAPLTAELAKAAVPFFDAGVSVRLVGNVGMNLSASYLSNTGVADVSAEIPHPFFFNQRRAISGQAPGVTHAELAAHVDAVYVIVSPQIDLALFGGATFFKVDQDLVSDVIFAETFPFDTATFVSAKLSRVSESRIGYNAGADVTWKFSPRWGIGGLLRFSRARVPFSLDGLDAGSADVGGLQAGGGLRLLF